MSCTTTLEKVSRTSLAEARGQCHGIIPNAQRLNEMQPLEHSAIVCSNIDRARYCCEIAQFRIANGMLAGAMQMLREALLIGCKWRWVGINGKFATTIGDPMRFIEKLRSCTFLTAEEYRHLKWVAQGKHPRKPGDAERMIDAVAKLVSPLDAVLEGGAR